MGGRYIVAPARAGAMRHCLVFQGPGAFGQSNGKRQGLYKFKADAQARADALNADLARPLREPAPLAPGYIVRLIDPRGASRWWLRYAAGDECAERYARRFATVYATEAAAQSAACQWLGWSDGGAFWNSERASAAAAAVAWRGWSYALEYQDATRARIAA